MRLWVLGVVSTIFQCVAPGVEGRVFSDSLSEAGWLI